MTFIRNDNDANIIHTSDFSASATTPPKPPPSAAPAPRGAQLPGELPLPGELAVLRAQPPPLPPPHGAGAAAAAVRGRAGRRPAVLAQPQPRGPLDARRRRRQQVETDCAQPVSREGIPLLRKGMVNR